MRIDAVSIFPEFFDVLDLSLIGKAQRDGLLELRRHQLRDFTTDRHRTVDDTPTGGGAGMVMKPEPWALALENVLAAPSPAERPVLIIPTPAGDVFTQRTAEELAAREHLVFAAGRYEGIDQRVTDWAQEHFDVLPLSIGDYVLNGGEAAIIVMVEAITRLLPGVLGNPESLDEESHADGLLEYPVYTKPAVWRGHEVPEILLSGNHAKIDEHRRQEQLLRTRRIRPDLYAKHIVAQEEAARRADEAQG
ncbi:MULTISPECIES: tRNA (guanosine(37)-N1)-methyltransferase TrmD [Actinomycetes]|uniref:tRNA (guanine-N(1)-)-methyltransferase n=2 Tax=Actinomycetes TaxID=1760 RepID=A0ABP6M2T2_9MICC|nr:MULTISPECIES: tRNA (guanosine(37)-N1)-methyltransferase TrmD [unclassified Nesterenkonia]MDS2172421.1 tRNA (guanosine(37)-N1)-methyltransferase TrmD [Nesterenkonia sp. CL21]OSM44527.1 tRNA (guanosine(37)-N1)-methyltransferase TrmD [Nesterenkonia sp. PF2B19]